MADKKLPSNININFNPKIDSEANLKNTVFESYQKNKSFFGKDSQKIIIDFIYKRSQMDKICNYKTEDWLVGYANKNHIFIFSPTVFSKISNHPQSDFSYVLTHEIAHIFTHDILDFYYPKWLHEGIAGYVAKQYKIRSVKKIEDFSKLHNKDSWGKFVNYPQAFSFTKYLVDKFGKKKILNFLENLRKENGCYSSYEEFVNYFNKFLKSDFLKLTLNWQKNFN